jgi:hypothetical protein
MKRFKVTLSRDEKTIIIILREDDYRAHVRKGNGYVPQMKYGSGKMWDVEKVEVAQ